jgi:DNA (cytosine-5)-methyltransferase 1
VHCQKSYEENFGEKPTGDITKILEADIPDHDICWLAFHVSLFRLLAESSDSRDTRGTLFFDIARIVQAKNPNVVILENVKLLSSHNNGKTLRVIKSVLNELGYTVYSKIFNALDFGLPQKENGHL